MMPRKNGGSPSPGLTRVCVRWMSLSRGRARAVRQRFAAEVKVASYLSHPNIGQVYELLQDGTTDFLTLELLKGRTLREEMDSLRHPHQIWQIVRRGNHATADDTDAHLPSSSTPSGHPCRAR